MRIERINTWLTCGDPHELEGLFAHADTLRHEHVGDEVFLRGLIEIGNYCRRECAYCGLHAGNRRIARYRLSADEIMEAARKAVACGFGTVVLQGGEDAAFSKGFVADIVQRIKGELGIAVTLSLGERTAEELAAWKRAGADRYLLRFETSDNVLMEAVHPPHPEAPGRFETLQALRDLDYEVGSGIMVGLPGQTFATLSRDIALFDELELDMIGIGPYLPHPDTPLGQTQAISALDCGSHDTEAAAPALSDQVPATPDMVYRAVALARILRPDANIPATTALGVADEGHGRLRALAAGANVVMPNCTPVRYRSLYEIYPGKDSTSEAEETLAVLCDQIHALGRTVGVGAGKSPSFLKRADRNRV